MLSYFHKYIMAEDIKFIKTDKEGENLENIINDEQYSSSIIYAKSDNKTNIYIGNNRVTDRYNTNKSDGDVTINNVGGISSGVNVSVLKGMSISEILDTILFVKNNNLTLKGVMVVDEIKNLTDSTLIEVYQGMVVSVLEDNSLYILLSESGAEREWKKVGSDINIEELKTSTKKLSSPITVAGLSGSIGNVSNGKTYTTDDTVEDILRDLLCKEIYPDVKLETVNPTITFGGINGVISSNYKDVMKVGSVLILDSVTLSEASISDCYRIGSGFTYGYSKDNDNKKDESEELLKQYGTSSLTGKYSLVEKYSPSSIGTVRSVNSSENYEDVKFNEGSVIIGLGSNKISLTAESPSGLYTHPEYPEYYVVSNLGNTDDKYKLERTPAINDVDVPSITKTENISVTGVYPVYVNIDSGKFVNETIEMELTASNTIEFDVPSEVASGIHFTFDYPSTHSVTSFEIWNKFENKFVNYAASYESESEIVEKDINGFKYQYNRFVTTGNLQGEGKYKITLSKRLDEK